LLEELKRWNNKDKFQNTINKATDDLNIDDALFIYNILQNKLLLDEKSIKKYKLPVIHFLENVYPNKAFKKSTLAELVSELEDLKTVSLKFAIAW
jgi:hypothetical protein